MKIIRVWPFLISTNPIWLSNGIEIFNLLAFKAHNEDRNGKYAGLLSQNELYVSSPKLLKIVGCLIITIKHFLYLIWLAWISVIAEIKDIR